MSPLPFVSLCARSGAHAARPAGACGGKGGAFAPHPLRSASRLLAAVLCALAAGVACARQGGAFRVQTEATLPLSIAQEAESAVDKARQWLAAQPPETNDLARAVIRRYALAPAGKPFTLAPCELTPLEQALPPPPAHTNLAAALSAPVGDPKALAALAAALSSPGAEAPAGWRRALALALVDAQRIAPPGGHWGGPEDTAWALLALRILLNDLPPLALPVRD